MHLPGVCNRVVTKECNCISVAHGVNFVHLEETDRHTLPVLAHERGKQSQHVFSQCGFKYSLHTKLHARTHTPTHTHTHTHIWKHSLGHQHIHTHTHTHTHTLGNYRLMPICQGRRFTPWVYLGLCQCMCMHVRECVHVQMNMRATKCRRCVCIYLYFWVHVHTGKSVYLLTAYFWSCMQE